jgi:hypothetical protein
LSKLGCADAAGLVTASVKQAERRARATGARRRTRKIADHAPYSPFATRTALETSNRNAAHFRDGGKANNAALSLCWRTEEEAMRRWAEAWDLGLTLWFDRNLG